MRGTRLRAAAVSETVNLAPVAAAALLVLDPGTLGGRGSLERTDPALRPTAGALPLPSSALGFAWARRGGTLALVAKPVATGQPVRVIDVAHWRVVRTIPVGDRDVCALTFSGHALLALASDRPCYWANGRFAILRFDLALGRVVRATRVTGLATAPPPSIAFGDGHAFVAHGRAVVDAVDLRSGRTVRHAPRRLLAKGAGLVWTRWLGGHRLGVANLVVDVHTWRAHALPGWVRAVAPAGRDVVGYGSRGVVVCTRTGVVRYGLLAGEDVVDAHVVGRTLYAGLEQGMEIVALRAGAQPRLVPGPGGTTLLLAP
jgi:hypothetical protein